MSAIPRFLVMMSLLLCLGRWMSTAAAQSGPPMRADDAEQVLFLLDDSTSMLCPPTLPCPQSLLAVFMLQAFLGSRWEVLRQEVTRQLHDLRPQSRVGAISLGGACGAAPPLHFPMGTAPGRILDAVQRGVPVGDTNLNRVLEQAPTFFTSQAPGRKRIRLLSDGDNTCPPRGSTCAIAQRLYRDHGIIIDVVAPWILDPTVAEEFKCIAAVTEATFRGEKPGRAQVTSQPPVPAPAAAVTPEPPRPPVSPVKRQRLAPSKPAPQSAPEPAPEPAPVADSPSPPARDAAPPASQAELPPTPPTPAPPRATGAEVPTPPVVVAAEPPPRVAPHVLIDLWRYIVLALGTVTLSLASLVLYRQGFHVLHWATSRATLAASLLFSLGVLGLYITLFAGMGLAAGLVGLGVLAAMLPLLGQRAPSGPPAPSGVTPQVMIALLLAVLVGAGQVSAQPSEPALTACRGLRPADGTPRYHHILILDMSGSATRYLPSMKALLRCYSRRYIMPGEPITVATFGSDETAAAKEISTFTATREGVDEEVTRLLKDLAVQDPKRTKTLYTPVAAFINAKLRQVRWQPVVLTLSDAKSDGRPKGKKGAASALDLPFDSLGPRGVYRAPGMAGWWVAIAGGRGLDLHALFDQPLSSPAPTAVSRAVAPPASPVLEACLLDPEPRLETPPRLVLSPSWNPFVRALTGSLSLRIQQCVLRFLSFEVALRWGAATIPLGKEHNAPVGPEPRTLVYPVIWTASVPEDGTARLELALQQGSSTRPVYPMTPASLTIQLQSYWAAHGLPVLLGSGSLLGLGLGLAWGWRRRHQRALARPAMIRTPGAPAVVLARFHPINLGGEPCEVAIPGIPTGLVLAQAEWRGVHGDLHLRPAPGHRLQVQGHDLPPDGAIYQLGQPIQCWGPQEQHYTFTLLPATEHDISLDAGSRWSAAASFPAMEARNGTGLGALGSHGSYENPYGI